MSLVILLSSAQAAAVRGVSAETSLAALEPRPLTDGRFFLGVEVLADPSHAEHWPLLSSLPQADYDTIASLVPQGS